ncbi:MAG: cysteine synthase A [Phycisphaerae bacterium]|jgi:cysteine synthase A
MNIANDITELIGKTPMVKLNKLTEGYSANVIVKLEYFNPGSSVKDRIGLNMILEAEKSGKLKPGMTIIEPTSGNTGVALALVAAARGYKMVLVMPESMTLERRKIITLLGAELLLTPASKGMTGAVKRAQEIVRKNPGYFMPQQFDNPANPQAHRLYTAEEIWADTDGKVDIFIAGVGTGGTISGIGTVLKEKNPDVKIVAVEPRDSAVLSGGQPGPHMIQGIGAGFIPKNVDLSVIDYIEKVSNNRALKYARKLAAEEGILAGISSGAAAATAVKFARRIENAGKNIVALLPDTAERYTSTIMFD